MRTLVLVRRLASLSTNFTVPVLPERWEQNPTLSGLRTRVCYTKPLGKHSPRLYPLSSMPTSLDADRLLIYPSQ
jgi:hypothetical protein